MATDLPSDFPGVRLSDEMNRELGRKLVEVCRMTDEMLRNMHPADRDRMLQTHLAAVRGPARNFALVCQATDALAPLRCERLKQTAPDALMKFLSWKDSDPRDLHQLVREAGI